jgi:hypothetical protein
MESTTSDSGGRTPKPQIDELRREVDSGLTVAAVAKKHNLPPSTLRGRLRRNGAKLAPLSTRDGAAGLAPNGAGVLRDLEALVDDRWRRLSLVERLRRLLA